MNIIPKQLIYILPAMACLVMVLNTCNGTRIVSNDLDGPESCHLRELELCSMGILSIIQNPNGLPMKESEFKRQCEYFNESIQCFEKYSNHCMTKHQAALIDVFTRNPIKLAREFCQVESEFRMNYTKHIECFREIQNKYQRPCLTDFQAGFEGIHKMNASFRLTTACCNMNRLKECIFTPIEYECGKASEEILENLLIAISGTWFTLPCRSYDSENPECKKILPKIGTVPHTGRNTSALSRVISGFTNVPAQL